MKISRNFAKFEYIEKPPSTFSDFGSYKGGVQPKCGAGLYEDRPIDHFANWTIMYCNRTYGHIGRPLVVADTIVDSASQNYKEFSN